MRTNDNLLSQFDDIRPLKNSEVPQAIEDLLNNPEFKQAVSTFMPDLAWEDLARMFRSYQTKEAFKADLSYKAVMKVAADSTFSLTSSGRSRLPSVPCTFISNHRDIVLDASFLNVLLYDMDGRFTQVAIGDNLLIRPWIDLFVRLNNSFIVRRGLAARESFQASKLLSEYIRYVIHEEEESIWIAQREGRAKDSNDRTQTALLKMLSMSGTDGLLEDLCGLNIMPVSISYEYDPCDYLKAAEFQLKRDSESYKKTPYDDLLSMKTGIVENKGRVHFALGDLINDKIRQIPSDLHKTEILQHVATIIDQEIFKRYRFYPGNYVAYDQLHKTRMHSGHYSPTEKKEFEDYLQKQLDKIDIPNKDTDFLRKMLLQMYANPLANQMSLSK